MRVPRGQRPGADSAKQHDTHGGVFYLSPSTPYSPGRFSQVRKYLARWAHGGAQRIGAERRRWHRSRARPVGAKGEAERGESQGAPLARLCEFSGGNSEAEIGILKERLRDY